MRLITGNHVMAERRRAVGAAGRCEECTLMVSDSIPHMLFECNIGHEVRTTMWNNVIVSSPAAMVGEMIRMNINERCEFLLSGFRCSSFVPEWSLSYINVCNFITTMYDNKITSMENI